MRVCPQSDFSYLIALPSGKKILVRDIIGDDLYYIGLVTNDYPEKMESPTFIPELFCRLTIEPYPMTLDELLELSARDYNRILKWFQETILRDKVMTAEDWLTLCFHLLKQRWTSDLTWLESQPLTKVLAMSDIQVKYHDEVNRKIKG